MKLVSARFCTQIISDITFEDGGKKKTLPMARHVFLRFVVVLRGVGHGRCEHLLLVVLSKGIVLFPRNSVLFKEVT